MSMCKPSFKIVYVLWMYKTHMLNHTKHCSNVDSIF